MGPENKNPEPEKDQPVEVFVFKSLLISSLTKSIYDAIDSSANTETITQLSLEQRRELVNKTFKIIEEAFPDILQTIKLAMEESIRIFAQNDEAVKKLRQRNQGNLN